MSKPNLNLYRFRPVLVTLLLLSIACNSKKAEEQSVTSTPVWQPLPAPEAWDPSWKTDQEVTVHTIIDPDNLHPVNGSSQLRSEINLYLHVSLLQTDLQTSEIRPGLCTRLPEISRDQLKLTFELRKEPHWDNGEPITAADIIFTAKVSKCPLVNNPASKPYFENIRDIVPDATNPRRFTVIMKQPYFQNAGIWCDYPIIQRTRYDSTNLLRNYMIPQFDDSSFNASADKKLAAWAEWFNTYPSSIDPSCISGAGPYAIEKWEAGQYITLKLKEKHWTNTSKNYWEKSYPKRITYHLNRDASSQLLAFKGQEYDATGSVSARTLLELRTDSAFNRNYHSAFINTYGYTYIGLNMKPDATRCQALKSKSVRRALAYAVPVQQIIDVVNKGVNKRVAGPVSFLKKSCDTTLVLIPFDPLKAASMLDAEGWKDTDKDGVRDKILDGRKVKLSIELAYLSVQPEWKDMAIMVKEGMAKAGVEVIAAGYDFPVWLDKAGMHDFDMIMGAWNNTAMPDDFSQLWSTKSYGNGGPNYSGFGNSESDALIDSMNVKMMDEERIPLELQLQKIIYDEQPYIFLYGLVRRSICHKRFSGASFYAERPGILYNTLKVIPGNRSVASVSP